jgi:receptor protein-tyrosine kinase
MNSIDPLCHAFFGLMAISAAKKRGPVVLGVASAQRGEGRSFVSESLAYRAASLSSYKIALVDGDLEQRGLTLNYGAGTAPGLSDVILNETSNPLAIETALPNLSFIGAGSACDSSILYKKDGLARFLSWGSTQAEAVIFDMPPFDSQAQPVLAVVDHVIVVIDASRTARSHVQSLVSSLSDSKAWGVVLNKCPSRTGPSPRS